MELKRVVLMVSIAAFGAGMAMGQTEWVQHPDNPVIEPGDPGPWDQGGPWARAAYFDGLVYHLWFTGSDQNGNPTDMGHATSPDGVEWTMDPANPVLTRGAPGEWDSARLDGAAVIHDGTQFHMWYSAWGNDNLERVGYATSPDGSVWTKHPGNPVMVPGPQGSWDDFSVRPTTVIAEGETLRMWFGGTTSRGGFPSRVGYAESLDGIDWTKRADPVLEPGSYPGAWDPQTVGNPYVVFDGSSYHMWYNGGAETSTTADLSIGYAFSSDGIHWSKHRDNPVVELSGQIVFHAPVVLDGSTWRMWYSHWDGSTSWISYATSDCCAGVAGLTHMQTIPAAAVASGAEGAFYQTDVDLNNAGSESVEYQLMWLPRGEDNSEPMTSETFSLGAGMSVRYANVLGEVFDLQPDSLGALALVSSRPDLLAMSRTYNTPSGEPGGTFGQAIPAVAPGDFMESGERRRILFASEHADLRTNVGCQNGTDLFTLINLELFDADGSSLETVRMTLSAWSNDQINRIFDAYRPVVGYVDVSTPMPDRSYFCYGSVLDNVTSDPTTILPQ